MPRPVHGGIFVLLVCVFLGLTVTSFSQETAAAAGADAASRLASSETDFGGAEETVASLEARHRRFRMVSVGIIAVILAAVFGLLGIAKARSTRRTRRHAAEFRLLMDQVTDAIMFFDPQGRLVKANTEACNLTGRSIDNLVRRPLDQILMHENLDAIEFGHVRDEVERSETFEARIRQPNGAIVAVECSAKLLVDGRVHVIARDVTKKIRARRERKELEGRVHEAQKLESLAGLAGGVAHDFNNILQGIVGQANEIVNDEPSRDRIKELVEDIQVSALRAGELTSQMLAYAGKSLAKLERVDVDRVVKRMQPLLESVASDKARLNLDFHAGIEVGADPGQLRQIVVNLVTNAAEAVSGRRKSTINVSSWTAKLRWQDLQVMRVSDTARPGDYVCVEVDDNGVGMDEWRLRRLFEPFFTTKFSGRGLGLAAVHGIVRAHGGAVHVESELGRGTTFRVFFPVDRQAGDIEEAPAEDPRWDRSVLVVESDPMLRDVAVEALEGVGHRVITACDGHDAIGILEEHASQVGCVVLDVESAGGIRAARRIKRFGSSMPIVIVCGRVDPESHEMLVRGMNHVFVRKPYDAEKIAAAVDNMSGVWAWSDDVEAPTKSRKAKREVAVA